ncbi:Low-density lipoprotein (LDL) receptor class A repeat [Trinorchestia longiramus]|nr:Low-density lipoprotein (LDL) receptor class A repeat [Trinorchestia longiramus]
MDKTLCIFILHVLGVFLQHLVLGGKLIAGSAETRNGAANGGPEMTLIVTPAEQPVVRGVGETLTLTCTLLPLSPIPANTSINATSADDALQAIMRRADQHQAALRKQKDLVMSQRLHWEENTPSPHWVIPINDVTRVSEEHLGSGDLSGIASVRVLVHRLQEADAGNYTCEVPQLQRRAVVQLHVLHRDVVQRCGVSSFQCSTGECILLRFVCDAKPDCPHATDELSEHCGFGDVCRNKLRCDDGRCMDPSRCCRGPVSPQSTPLNCSVNPSIHCCRQLIHPAALDQDLFYLSTRPRPHVRPGFFSQPSPLFIGTLVALANIGTVCLVLTLRRRFWPPASPSLALSPLTWWRHTSREALGVVGGASSRPWSRWSRVGSYPRPPRHRCSGPHSVSFSAFSQVTSGVADDASPSPAIHPALPYSTPPPSYQEAVCGPPPPYYSPALHRSARSGEECVPLHASARRGDLEPGRAGHCRCPVPSVPHSSSNISTATSDYIFAIPVSVVRSGNPRPDNFIGTSSSDPSHSVSETSRVPPSEEPGMLANEATPGEGVKRNVRDFEALRRIGELPPSGARGAVRSASSAAAGRKKVSVKRRRVARTGSDGGASNPLLSEAVVVRACQLSKEQQKLSSRSKMTSALSDVVAHGASPIDGVVSTSSNSFTSMSGSAQLRSAVVDSDSKEVTRQGNSEYCVSQAVGTMNDSLKASTRSPPTRTEPSQRSLLCSQTTVTTAVDEHSVLHSSSSSSCLALSSESQASSLSSAASSLSF